MNNLCCLFLSFFLDMDKTLQTLRNSFASDDNIDNQDDADDEDDQSEERDRGVVESVKVSW